MSIWDDVKAIPIDEVARRLGVELPRSGTMRCPFPDHDDRQPSFSIIRKSNGCYCHGCQRGGSVIDFVLNIQGCTALAAVEWLQDNFLSRGARASKQPSVISKANPLIKRTNTSEEDFKRDPPLYARFLADNQMKANGKTYLEKRKISEKTILAFHVGYIEDAQAALKRLVEAEGVRPAIKAGLIVGNERGHRLIFSSRSLLFPFFEGGEISYLQTRAVDAVQNRWMGLNRIEKPIYNTDSINAAKDVYICEGCLDVLSAYELRRVAIGFTGAETKLTASVLNALRSKTVYIVPDDDPAGVRMAERTLSTLRKWGVQAAIQKLPRGKDLNEYLILKRARS